MKTYCAPRFRVSAAVSGTPCSLNNLLDSSKYLITEFQSSISLETIADCS